MHNNHTPVEWRPTREITLVAGTPPGGGLDRVARALAKALTQARLLDVPINVLNVPGDGARRAWSHVDQYQGDPHVLSISSPNLTSDYLVGLASFDHSRYTPIATLITEISPLRCALVRRCRPAPICWAAWVMTPRKSRSRCRRRSAIPTMWPLPSSRSGPVATSTRPPSGSLTPRWIVADVIAGHADVAAVTAASVLAELNAGRLRLLAISAPVRLPSPFADTPTWKEQSADCVIGAWRGVTGPKGLTADQVRFWEGVLRTATKQPAWREELTRLSWSPMSRG